MHDLMKIFREAIEANDEERSRILAKLPAKQRREIEQLLAADADANERNLLSSFEVGIEDASPQFSVPEKIRDYRLGELIGEGGMGKVFRARHERLNREFAIKLFNVSNSASGSLARFEREIEAIGAISHPNIVDATDAGIENEIRFLVMELVEGVNLRQIVKSRGQLDVADAAEVIRQTALGLQHAHSNGLVHRDVKPSNLMISKDGMVKITDMGLAMLQHLNSDLSTSGQLMGTLDYIAPEQISSPRAADERSDLYSLGCTFYNALTSKAPFAAPKYETIFQKLRAHEKDTPPLLSKVRPDLPSELIAIVNRLLAKDPSNRYQTANDLIKDVAVFAEGNALGQLVHSTKSKPQGDPNTDREFEKTVRFSWEIEQADDAPTVGDAAVSAEIPSVSLANSGLSTSLVPEPGPIRYAQSGSVNIAWQEIGKGPIDIVFVMGWVSHLEYFWKDPGFNAFLTRLASIARVILFDKRGTGLSDKVAINELPNLETRMDDVRAVMDAAGCKTAVLCGVSEGGPMCSLFAATYPEKTIALMMIGCYARRLWAEDYPWGPTHDQRAVFLDEIGRNWGGPLGIEDRAPSKADDPEFRQWWADYLRMGASPGAAVALTKMNAQIDVRSILPTIQVPTLIIHRTGDQCLKVDEGRHMADLIPGAKFVELPGKDHLPFVGDADSILEEIEVFLTGKRQAQEVDRVLATVLNVRVESPMPVEQSGSDSSSQQFLSMLVREAELFRGKNLTIDKSSYSITFDGPARAVRAAKAIVALAKRMNVDVRCGVDTGICDVSPGGVSGQAVDKAQQIAGAADSFAVFISESVLSLVSGSGLSFESKADDQSKLYRLNTN